MNIKEEVIIKELKEEYFKRTGRKIEEYGYCTIASEIKEIEPEYLEHEELYKKLDYLHSIVINNIGQHLIKRKETYNTLGELNIHNCYSDNHTWDKLTIARKKLKSDLKAELFKLALRYESKNNETLNIHNCYENEEYWEIVDTIRRINLTIEYQEQVYSPYYQAQPEKEKQERLQNSYIKFLEELYEKQVGIWIANQYVIVETYGELEKYHERYWEREPTSVLEQPL
ncbi:hypothetical protein C2G38_2155337 [Gigaspora rosea]|uniref:Uncharacterized protein n=1 Tax=Gigaspora rosea TaxID=44941 RepID=A0A397W3Y5_9GLOM|nr:hypothetical protein C2G38_2155337 [Gigaspora rosea]